MIVREDVIHSLYMVNPKLPTRDIELRECRVVVTGKRTWVEPLMPLRGVRDQKRFLIGASAFYTLQQAERAKLTKLLAIMRAPRYLALYSQQAAYKQLQYYKEHKTFVQEAPCATEPQ